MARVNIEASAALAEWVDIYRSDPGGGNYVSLVNRAVSYLPMPRKTSALEMTELWALADASMATRVVEAAGAECLARVRAGRRTQAEPSLRQRAREQRMEERPCREPPRGASRRYPIHCRRFAPSEERELMDFASGRLALGMTVCQRFAMERPRQPWEEQVLPYGLAEILLITPSRWRTTEATREVRLPA